MVRRGQSNDGFPAFAGGQSILRQGQRERAPRQLLCPPSSRAFIQSASVPAALAAGFFFAPPFPALLAAGASPRYTEIPGTEHDCWNYAYRNPAFYEWLFAQRKQVSNGRPA